MSRKPPRSVAAPPLDRGTVLAFKALAAGNANEHQQRRALRHVVDDLCDTYGPAFDPDSEWRTAYAAGRRSVGLAITKTINLPNELLPEKKDG